MPYEGKNYDPNYKSNKPNQSSQIPEGSGYKGVNYDPSKDKSARLQPQIHVDQMSPSVPAPFQGFFPQQQQRSFPQQQQFVQIPQGQQQQVQKVTDKDGFLLLYDDIEQLANFIFVLTDGLLVTIGSDVISIYEQDTKTEEKKAKIREKPSFKLLREEKLSHPTFYNLPFFVFDAKIDNSVLFIATNFGLYYVVINAQSLKISKQQLTFKLIFPLREEDDQCIEGQIFRNLSVFSQSDTYYVTVIVGQLDYMNQDSFTLQEKNSLQVFKIIVDKEDPVKSFKVHILCINKPYFMSCVNNDQYVFYIYLQNNTIYFEGFQFAEIVETKQNCEVSPLFTISISEEYNYNELILLGNQLESAYFLLSSFQGYAAIISVTYKHQQQQFLCIPILQNGKTQKNIDVGQIMSISHLSEHKLLFLQSSMKVMKVGYAYSQGAITLELQQIIKKFTEPVNYSRIDGKSLYTSKVLVAPKPKVQLLFVYLKDIKEDEDDIELQINVLP